MFQAYIDLLRTLIQTPSFSREEDKTADVLAGFFQQRNVPFKRKDNNIWAYNKYYSPDKPTILLNSHHDTVKVNPGYSRDPFSPDIEDGKLYGLGSNDAGASLVSLMAAFMHYYESESLPFNLCFAASAEEEISGRAGIESIVSELGPLSFALVGEPTLLDLAISEKGLMVLDCTVEGISGHAAREEGVNALYKALPDIEWFRTYQFPKSSELCGPVKMSVTVIHAGSQHNVVPALCEFVVDVRVTDAYTNQEVLDIIREQVDCRVEPRSTRLNPSSIPASHPVVQAGIRLGKKTYGSPTMSDQALLPIPSLKVGPGDSARSHSADEFIYVNEIEAGIHFYIDLLNGLL